MRLIRCLRWMEAENLVARQGMQWVEVDGRPEGA